MNVILVPALLLLVGLAVYKKIIEPRRAGESTSKPGKASKGATPQKAARAAKAPKASKSRPTVTSGRMGSVL